MGVEPLSLASLGAGEACFLAEQTRKVERVFITKGIGDDLNGQICSFKHPFGFAFFGLPNEVTQRNPLVGGKEPGTIGTADTKFFAHIGNDNRMIDMG